MAREHQIHQLPVLAEDRGIEPLAQGLPWCSKPVADHSAVSSTIGENGGS
ncbi:hypothetical protein H6G00_20270 [Leptolyngbya sp. FACHB-541]|nr:hypothetical protein [Leptolyngbya sp. FACHB-541]